jgi:plastocyanin
MRRPDRDRPHRVRYAAGVRTTPSPRTLARALACAAAALGALTACGDPANDGGGPPPVPCSSATATATTRVFITTAQFAPYCTKVPVGVPVTFTNADFGTEHTVTADDGSFESGILFPGQQFSHTFAAPTAVRVHCRFFPEVSGRVIAE